MKTYVVEILIADGSTRLVLVAASSISMAMQTLAEDPEFGKRYRLEQVNSVKTLKQGMVEWL